MPGEGSAEFLRWLDGYLEAYETLVRPACIVQAERLAAGDDIIRLDAEGAVFSASLSIGGDSGADSVVFSTGIARTEAYNPDHQPAVSALTGTTC